MCESFGEGERNIHTWRGGEKKIYIYKKYIPERHECTFQKCEKKGLTDFRNHAMKKEKKSTLHNSKFSIITKITEK